MTSFEVMYEIKPFAGSACKLVAVGTGNVARIGLDAELRDYVKWMNLRMIAKTEVSDAAKIASELASSLSSNSIP